MALYKDGLTRIIFANLSLRFKQEEFCDVLKAHRKTLALAGFAGLERLL